MKIAPNFMKSLEGKYRKASMMNTLKENLDTRQARTDDYFSDMYSTAESKGLPAYEEANTRAKDLKRISRMLRDRYDLTDAQILGLAQRPTGLYGSGLSGIEKAITNADTAGRPLTQTEILSVFETAEQIQLPEGMTFDNAIAKLAGIYTGKASQDPEAKDEKNIFTNLLSSALSLNPKLNATDMLENSNIGGISAKDLLAQTTTLPSTNLFDVDFSDRTLGRRSAIEDERMRKYYFKDFLAQMKGASEYLDATSSFTSASSSQAIYANIPELVFELEEKMEFNQFEAIDYIKDNINKLTSGENPETIDQIRKRVQAVVDGTNINALEDPEWEAEKDPLLEYNIPFFVIDNNARQDSQLKITKSEQSAVPELKDAVLKLQNALDKIKFIEDKIALVYDYLHKSVRLSDAELNAEDKLAILKQALKIAQSTN